MTVLTDSWSTQEIRSARFCRRRLQDFLDADIRVLPLTPFGKEPLTCYEHAACRRFVDGVESATKNLGHLLAVESEHPDINYGLVPGDTLLVVDVDTYKAYGNHAKATLIRAWQSVAPHVIIRTPRGGQHFWLRRTSLRDYKSIPAVDLRWGDNGYVLAPGSRVIYEDGHEGEYVLEDGTWGEFQVDRGIEALFLPASDSRPAAPLQEPSSEATDTNVARVVAAWQSLLAEYIGDGDPENKVTWDGIRWLARTDASESADLCALWNVAYWRGLTPEQAVDALLTYRPTLAGTRLERPRNWLLSNATRAFETAEGPTGLRSVRRQFTTPELDNVTGRQRDLLAYAVDMANTSQSELVYLGTQAIADHFGVAKNTAAGWLRKLRDRGLITVMREHFCNPEEPEQGRVRLYAITGLISLCAPTATRERPEPSSVESYVTPLSHPQRNPRVEQVLDLTRRGFTNTEIAHELDISMRSVQRLRAQGEILAGHLESEEPHEVLYEGPVSEKWTRVAPYRTFEMESMAQKWPPEASDAFLSALDDYLRRSRRREQLRLSDGDQALLCSVAAIGNFGQEGMSMVRSQMTRYRIGDNNG